MSKDLKMRLSIYSNNNGDYCFYSEAEIANDIPMIIDLVKSGAIRLGITDGIISIKYKGEELLGKEYWDDIHLILNDVFYSLNSLLNGDEIKRVLPMQSIWVNLAVNNDDIIYNLKSSKNRNEKTGEIDLVRKIPKIAFMKEFTFFYLRSVRILATIGAEFRTYTDQNLGEDEIIGHNFDHVFQKWREYIPPNIFSSDEIKDIEKLMDMPLPELVANYGC